MVDDMMDIISDGLPPLSRDPFTIVNVYGLGFFITARTPDYRRSPGRGMLADDPIATSVVASHATRPLRTPTLPAPAHQTEPLLLGPSSVMRPTSLADSLAES